MQFGVCLWEIVTAQIPIRGDIFTPTSGECPEEVARLIKDCMQQHPADRPSAPEIYRSGIQYLFLTTVIATYFWMHQHGEPLPFKYD